MTPEQYFLLYAFPCSQLKFQRGDITSQTYEQLHEHAVSGNPYSKVELEKIYAPAIANMKEVASKIGKPIWSIETIATYFLIEHNQYIDAGKGNYAFAPESMRNFCKVYPAKVISKTPDALVVNYPSGKRNVSSALTPYAKVGDSVTIHHGFAVEIIKPDSICWKYLRK